MSYTPINRTIYRKLTQIIPNLPEHLAKGTQHGNSKKELPLMDLSYDFLHEDNPGEYIISLQHYFEMNGDLVPDPDMEIRVIPSKEVAEALSFQNQFLYQHVGHEKVNEKLQRDLNSFLDQWLSNCISYGHKIDLARINERSREDELDDLREDEDKEREQGLER